MESRRVRLTVIKVAEGRGTVQLQREAAAAFLPIRECWRAGYHIHGFYVVRSRTALKNFVDLKIFVLQHLTILKFAGAPRMRGARKPFLAMIVTTSLPFHQCLQLGHVVRKGN
jgi:hypothetical protein